MGITLYAITRCVERSIWEHIDLNGKEVRINKGEDPNGLRKKNKRKKHFLNIRIANLIKHFKHIEINDHTLFFYIFQVDYLMCYNNAIQKLSAF